jgi:hypothetical protein
VNGVLSGKVKWMVRENIGVMIGKENFKKMKGVKTGNALL